MVFVVIVQNKLSSYIDSLADEILSGKFSRFTDKPTTITPRKLSLSPDKPTLPQLRQATKGKCASCFSVTGDTGPVDNFRD